MAQLQLAAVTISEGVPSEGILDSHHQKSDGFVIAVSQPIDLVAGATYAPARSEAALESATRADCYDSAQVALMAARQSVLARLLRQHSANEAEPQHHGSKEPSLMARYACYQADRQAQVAAEQAKMAHFAILNLLEAVAVQEDALGRIEQAQESQELAIQSGLPIANPTQLEVLRIQMLDQLQASRQLLQTTRVQLARLVPAEVACRYWPCPEEFSVEAGELCDAIDYGCRHRPDLQGMRWVAQRLTIQDLDSNSALFSSLVGGSSLAGGSLLTGVPFPKAKLGLMQLLGVRAKSDEARLRNARRQLCEVVQALEQQIASEIEQAWIQWQSAGQRLDLAVQLIEERRMRLAQLDAMEEQGRPQAIERFQAQMELIESVLQRLKRANDRSDAGIRLESAMGRLPCR